MSSFSFGRVEPVFIEPIDYTPYAQATGRMASAMAVTMGGSAAVAVAGGIAAAAGVTWGAGYLLYKSGQAIVSAAEKAKQNRLAKEQQVREEEQSKLEIACQETEKMKKICQGLVKELDSLTEATEGFSDEIQSWTHKLSDVCNQKAFGTSLEQEMFNHNVVSLMHQFNDWKSQMLEASKNNYRNQKRMIQAQEAINEMEEALKDYVPLTLAVSDVQAMPPSLVYLKEHRDEFMHVAIEVRSAMRRESERKKYGLVSSEHQKGIGRLFYHFEEDADLLLSGTLSPKDAEKKYRELKDRLSTYRSLAASEDVKMNDFSVLYALYGDLAKAVKEEQLPVSHFASYQELDEMVKSLQVKVESTPEYQMLEKKEKLFMRRQNEYWRMGRELYIAKAFYNEMKALGYPVNFRNEVQAYFSNGLKPVIQEESELPLFTTNNSSMQVYQIGKHTFASVMIHPDGSTTVETFTDYKHRAEDNVVNEQKKFCGSFEKLKNALLSNWFLNVELNEDRGPEYIMACDENHTVEGGWINEPAGVKYQYMSN